MNLNKFTIDRGQKKYVFHSPLTLKDKDLKSFFKSSGVSFPKETSIELLQGNFLLVNNIQKNHRALKKIIRPSFVNNQLLLVAQIFEVTKPEYLRNVVLPYARQIIAIPNQHRKVTSRIATIGPSNYFVADQKTKACLVYGKDQQITPSFIGTTLESTSLIDSDGVTISINLKWLHNLEKSRKSTKKDGKEYLVSDLKTSEVNQRLKLWDGESAVIPLSQDSQSRRFLIISARILNPQFKFIRESSRNDDSLAPDGNIELFRNNKTGKIRILTPAAQDDFLKRANEKRLKDQSR